VQVIFLFIYHENHSQSTVMKKKRQETHWWTLNAKWARRKAILYFTAFIRALSSNNGVLGNGCAIHCINTFSYYRWMFKRRALLSQSCLFRGYIYVSEHDLLKIL